MTRDDQSADSFAVLAGREERVREIGREAGRDAGEKRKKIRVETRGRAPCRADS